jgi:hypothetical protein
MGPDQRVLVLGYETPVLAVQSAPSAPSLWEIVG